MRLTFGQFLIVVGAAVGLAYAAKDSRPRSNPVPIPAGVDIHAPPVYPAYTPPPPAWRDVSLDFKLQKGGFGVVAVAAFGFKNNSAARVWDMRVKCSFYAQSGTLLGSKIMTIYESIEPGKTKRVRDISFSFIDQQASKGDCELVGAQEGPATLTPKPKNGRKA